MVAWAPALTFCQHLKGKVTTYLRPEGPGQDHDDITCFSGFLIFSLLWNVSSWRPVSPSLIFPRPLLSWDG